MAEKNWRYAFQTMERDHYIWLRKSQNQSQTNTFTDDEMRRKAFEYASKCCQDAIAAECGPLELDSADVAETFARIEAEEWKTEDAEPPSDL